MRTIAEINDELRVIRESKADKYTILRIAILAEEKALLQNEEIRPLSAYLKTVGLQQDDIKRFVGLRNSIVHAAGPKSHEDIDEKWIRNVVIPAIMRFPRSEEKFRTEQDIVFQLGTNFESLGFQVKYEVPIKLGKRLVYRADMLLDSKSQQILVEVKRGDSSRAKDYGIQQLSTGMAISGLELGLLIHEGIGLELLEFPAGKILVLGLDDKSITLEMALKKLGWQE